MTISIFRRSLSKFIFAFRCNDELSITDNGNINWNLGAWVTSRANNQGVFPVASQLTRLSLRLNVNNVTVASTNTMSFEIDGTEDLGVVLTITDTTAVGIVQADGVVNLDAGALVLFEWNSDSVGNADINGIGCSGVIL